MGSGVEGSTGIGMVCCSGQASVCLSLGLSIQICTKLQQTNATDAVVVYGGCAQ